ncbi:MAG: putative integral membrane protein (TIGR00698 family) [Planctomycetota bacterium]|jgi:uncharacterized integral membrane protein (TIGR00698 family)
MIPPMDSPRLARIMLPLLALVCVALQLPGVIGLGLGALVAAWLGPWSGGQQAGSQLLKLGVIFLGAGSQFGEVLSVGSEGLATAAITLGAAALGTLLIGRWLRLPRNLMLLIGTGTAICGGSAIAAAAPALRAKGEDVSMAMAVIFVLNAAALILFPILGHALDLDPAAYGRLCALAIHDTSSVVSAAAEWGADSLQIATVTKLARALWILPVAFGLSFLKQEGEDVTGPKKRVHIPGFLVAFLLASAAVQLFPALRPVGMEIASAGKVCLRLALLAMGLGMSRKSLAALGWRPLAHGILLWGLLTSVALVLCR